MQRITIAFLLMAAAALPRMGTQVSGSSPLQREESVPPEALPLAETPKAGETCCNSPNHAAHLLCLHHLALSQMAQSARAAVP